MRLLKPVNSINLGAMHITVSQPVSSCPLLHHFNIIKIEFNEIKEKYQWLAVRGKHNVLLHVYLQTFIRNGKKIEQNRSEVGPERLQALVGERKIKKQTNVMAPRFLQC